MKYFFMRIANKFLEYTDVVQYEYIIIKEVQRDRYIYIYMYISPCIYLYIYNDA